LEIFHKLILRAGYVEGDGMEGFFQVGELAFEQAGRHEMVLSLHQAVVDQIK
jgi:hypothetical protein